MTTEADPSISGIDAAKIKGRLNVGNVLAVMQMVVICVGGVMTLTSVRDQVGFIQVQVVDMKADVGKRIDGLSNQVSKLDDRIDAIKDHASR